MYAKNQATLQAFTDNFYIQLEEGTSFTSYEPYVGGQPSPSPSYPQPIKSVVGEIKNKIQNKNLAWTGWAEDFVSRIDNINNAEILMYDNRKCLKIQASAGYPDYDNKYIFKTNFKENTQYTFCFDFLTGTSVFHYGNFSIYYTDGTNQTIATVNNNNWNKFIVTSALNKTIKYITPYYTNGYRYIDIDTFMVLEGAYTEQTIPDYVPHAEQNLPFTLEEGQFLADNEELQDEGMHKESYKFLPTEVTGVVQHTSTGLYYCYIINLPKKCNNAQLSNMKSTHFRAIQNVAKGNFYLSSQTTLVFVLNDQTLTTKESVDNWLQTQANNDTPVEFKLILDESEFYTIPYNSTQQAQYNAIKKAHSYNDITYIESTSDELSPILEVQYWLKDSSEIETQESIEENNLSFKPIENEDEITNEINIINEDDIIESEVIPDEENN